MEEKNYELYIVLKVTGEKGRCLVCMHQGRKIFAYGNIPVLYNGMGIGLSLSREYIPEADKEGYYIKDYDLRIEGRNETILRNNKVDPEWYRFVLATHMRIKDKGYSWYEATLSEDDLYVFLPFPKADALHKDEVNDEVDNRRLLAINRLILKKIRARRKTEISVNEYLKMFEEEEENGAYPKLSLSIKCLCFTSMTCFGIENGQITDKEIKEMEKYVMDDIKERKDNGFPMLDKSEIEGFKATLTGLSEEQTRVLDGLRYSVPVIVTGGAGTGKTTVIKAIIDCYGAYYNKNDVLLVAPTGKAARRLEEKTNFPANTIHKALRKSIDASLFGQKDEDGDEIAGEITDGYIYYNEDRKMPYKLIVIDESSMIDVELMCDLLKATDKRSKLIFVGDHNQLYPVGYGEPFFDFLQILKVYLLKENHRQQKDTDILPLAQRVLDMKKYTIIDGSGLNGIKTDCIYFDEMKDIISDDADTQIMSPYNKVNESINEFLKKGNGVFNEGDKVIAGRNTPEYSNGEIGRVLKIYDEKSVFGKSMKVEIGDRNIRVKERDFKDFSLAYAITIHKMQGSECDRAILFLPKDYDGFIDRRMLYTAVTRAKKKLEIYYVSDREEEKEKKGA